MNRRMLLESLLKKPRLPAEFKEVEYLESTGTQYIDSGVYPILEDKLSFKARGIVPNNEIGMIFGSYGAGGFGVQSYDRNIRIFGVGSWLNTDIPITNDFTLTTSNKTTINGIDFNIKVNNENNNQNYYIFGGNFNGVLYMLLTGCRFYYCKIARSDGTLLRDFVPCYRKADNVAGLYDLVNGVFYTNAGTGTFIVGGNV